MFYRGGGGCVVGNPSPQTVPEEYKQGICWQCVHDSRSVPKVEGIPALLPSAG